MPLDGINKRQTQKVRGALLHERAVLDPAALVENVGRTLANDGWLWGGAVRRFQIEQGAHFKAISRGGKATAQNNRPGLFDS